MSSIKRLLILSLTVASILSAAPASAAPKGPTIILQKHVPYTITSPGSYVLGSNLIVTDPNVTAIFIAGNDVTLDLAGFSIQGPEVGEGGGSDASAIDTLGTNVAVRNGSVRGFDSSSLACVNLPGLNNRVESVRVENCSLVGIFVGIAGHVEHCQVSSAGSGIGADHGSIVSANTLFNIAGAAIGAQGDGGVMVIGNNCRESGVCIRTTSDGNRIESNVLTASGVGLDLTVGADNYFARNFLQGNTTAVLGAADDRDGGTVDPALSNIIIP